MAATPSLRRLVCCSFAFALASASAWRPAHAQALPDGQTGRPDVQGTTAAVTAGHPLAAAAGARVLREGGNAVDAAITTAAVLAVVRPHMNGIGGDAFLLIRDASTGEVHALNGSGRAGSLATPAHFAELDLDEIPGSGILSVSVPGAVRAWEDALERFGTITLAEALAPAIHYAEDGFPVSTILAEDIAGSADEMAEDPALAAVFMPDGEVPPVGSILRQTDLAATLRQVAERGSAGFYRGDVADAIVSLMERDGGLLTARDLATHESTWHEPLEIQHRGFRVLAFPPNTQGLALLMQLNMAEHFDLEAMGHNTPKYVHTMVELKKLAFHDRDRYVADPFFVDVPVERLISEEYAAELAGQVTEQATTPESRDDSNDTVYLAVVDSAGNAVSLIESLFSMFGSGRMVPGTGIILQNRGSLFTLDPTHPNVVEPGKRPYHTLSPSMVLHPDASLFMVFGTPGGDGQTQTLAQVFNNIVLFDMTPQQAVEAPRWRSYSGGRLALEPGYGVEVAEALAALGHDVDLRDSYSSAFGGAQVILVDPESGALRTGADFRREGYAVAW